MNLAGGINQMRLLERETELESIGAWMSGARDGRGRVALVLAGAGLGKTTLLDRAAVLGAEAGLRVLRARGSELEREMPFGIARQLFDATVRALDPADRRAVLSGAAAHTEALLGLTTEPAVGGDPFGVIHGLYWLAANLSEMTPLLLVIDDLQWSDSQTARWLGYLAARVADLPILVLAGARADEPDGDAVVSTVTAGAPAETVRLRPLGVSSVAELVRAQFRRAGEPAFIEACHTAAGGNPFFAMELLRAAAADGIEPTREHAPQVHQLGPPDVARSILIRLARLGEPARQIASAIAVLGMDAEVRHIAEFCEISAELAFSIWDVLARAEVLQRSQPLEFIHPIARRAVYREMAPGERTRAHRLAAAILAADGVEPARVAVHASACEPAGDAQLVQWLRDAAEHALRSGAPDAAASYLERALLEPPALELRPRVRFELGQALLAIDVSGAAENLARAAQAAQDPVLRMLAHRWSGYALAYAGLMADAIAAFDKAIELAPDPELALLIAGSRDYFAAWWADDPERAQRVCRVQEQAARLNGATPGERRVLAAAAINICLTGSAPASDALALAVQFGSAGPTFTDSDEGDETGAVGTVTLLCDQPGPSIYDELWPEMAAGGGILQAAFARSAASYLAFRRGALFDAETDARAGWETFAPLSGAPTIMYWWSLTPLIQVLIGRGLLDEASALVESTGLGQAKLDTVIFPWPAVVLGELALARGRSDEGIALLLEAGTWLEQRGFTNPSYTPWRAAVAPALAACGRLDEARQVIATAIARARTFGAPWGLGMALRAAGTIEQGTTGVELLHEALAVLEPSPCRVEHAHALLELGAALRRAREPARAREHLRAALDMSSRCGAVELATRAEQELAATGARPRRVMLSGIESLTASERRVAELATTGLSNPEIAQRLFVTRKTVESHLGHVYLKLDISSRDQLPAALSADSRSEAAGAISRGVA